MSEKNEVLQDGPTDAPCLALAHGAGLPMDSPFMNTFAHLFAACGVACARFEFAYMAARREGAPRRPPPAVAGLCDEFRSRLDQLGTRVRFIGGKSLGGRIATMIAQTLYQQGRIDGVVCLGYPFHPPNLQDVLRIEHLKTVTCPIFIAQGTRDVFGTRQECARYALSSKVRIHWVEHGNHHLEVPKSSGTSTEDVWRGTASAAAAFMRAGQR